MQARQARFRPVGRQRASVPSSEELREWLDKHLANAPERSQEWHREVMAIYRPDRDWSNVVFLPKNIDRADD